MEIKIQFKNRVFSIMLGNDTKWFSQMSKISIIEEFYNDSFEIVYATTIWSYGA